MSFRPYRLFDLALSGPKSYFLDKTIRYITGTPPTYDETEVCHITTVFPRTRDEYVSVCGFDFLLLSPDASV